MPSLPAEPSVKGEEDKEELVPITPPLAQVALHNDQVASSADPIAISDLIRLPS